MLVLPNVAFEHVVTGSQVAPHNQLRACKFLTLAIRFFAVSCAVDAQGAGGVLREANPVVSYSQAKLGRIGVLQPLYWASSVLREPVDGR